MKKIQIILITVSVLLSYSAYSQNETSAIKFPSRKLTTEPGIGIKPYPISDVVFSNVLQWNIKRKINLVAYSSYTYNNAFLRNFNYIKTNYNYSLNQKAGIGTTFYSRHFSQTISLMAGIKYDAFKETLENPDFEKVSMAISSVSPDFAFMYNLKVGKKKYFFSYRMVLPLYPYPIKTSDINAIDCNLANLSMEFGLGIRLK